MKRLRDRATKTIYIIKWREGVYDFREVPQHSLFRAGELELGSDLLAIAQAERLNPDPDVLYKIDDQSHVLEAIK